MFVKWKSIVIGTGFTILSGIVSDLVAFLRLKYLIILLTSSVYALGMQNVTLRFFAVFSIFTMLT